MTKNTTARGGKNAHGEVVMVKLEGEAEGQNLTTSLPPSYHPAYHLKDNENNNLTTLTTFNVSSWENSSFQNKIGLLAPLGEKVEGGKELGLAQPGERLKKDMQTRLVGCSSGSGIPNSMGQRVGEDHPASKLTQAQVDSIRDRYEAGQRGEAPRIGMRLLAKEFDISLTAVAKILAYQTWAAYPTRWKRITL